MTLADAKARLAGLTFVNYAHDRGNGDLLLSHDGSQKCEDEQGWTFAEVSAVAAALGCVDIDIAAVVASEVDDLPMQRWRDGCETCGYGDTLIVRGILTA